MSMNLHRASRQGIKQEVLSWEKEVIIKISDVIKISDIDI